MLTLPSVIVFDLDDTLYLERDFALSGFRAAGDWLERTTGESGLAQVCLSLFDSGRRKFVFDEAIDILGIPRTDNLVSRLVNVYRFHSPDIALAHDADRYLRRSPDSVSFAIITDGIASTQSAKVRALGLDRLVDHVIYTGAWGTGFYKPHPRAFKEIEVWFGKSGPELVYVADNPVKDFLAPKALGWWTVKVLRPERIHHLGAPSREYEAHTVISTFDQLDDLLLDLRSTSIIAPPNGTVTD